MLYCYILRLLLVDLSCFSMCLLISLSRTAFICQSEETRPFLLCWPDLPPSLITNWADLKDKAPSPSWSASFIMALRPRWVCGAPSRSIMTLSSARVMKPLPDTLYLPIVTAVCMREEKLLLVIQNENIFDQAHYFSPLIPSKNKIDRFPIG